MKLPKSKSENRNDFLDLEPQPFREGSMLSDIIKVLIAALVIALFVWGWLYVWFLLGE